eukprot:364620-Chlamydomonas_euryale.AAC.11
MVPTLRRCCWSRCADASLSLPPPLKPPLEPPLATAEAAAAAAAAGAATVGRCGVCALLSRSHSSPGSRPPRTRTPDVATVP